MCNQRWWTRRKRWRRTAFDAFGNSSTTPAVPVVVAIPNAVLGVFNPGFEELSATEIPGWKRTGPKETTSTTAGEYHSGTRGLKIVAEPGKWQMAWQDWMGYSVGNTYQLTFWGKVVSTEGLRGRVPVLTIPPPGGGKSLVFAYVDVTEPKWTKYSMTFSTPTASDGLRIRCYESTNTLNGTIYFDDFKISTVTKPSGPPKAPIGVTMTPGQGTINLSWTEPNSLVDSYRVDLSTSSQFTSYVTGWSNRDVGHMNSVQVTGLKANTMYYARVRAYNKIGGTSPQSNISSITLTGSPAAVAAALNSSLAPGTVDGARAYPIRTRRPSKPFVERATRWRRSPCRTISPWPSLCGWKGCSAWPPFWEPWKGKTVSPPPSWRPTTTLWSPTKTKSPPPQSPTLISVPLG